VVRTPIPHTGQLPYWRVFGASTLILAGSWGLCHKLLRAAPLWRGRRLARLTEAIRGVLVCLCVSIFLASDRFPPGGKGPPGRAPQADTAYNVHRLTEGPVLLLTTLRAGFLRSGAKIDRFVLKVDLTIADETFCEYYVYVQAVSPGRTGAPIVPYFLPNVTSAITI